MAVGKQDEETIVHWHPGETTGLDGLNQSVSIPTDEDQATASGIRTFFDNRVNTVNTRLSTLSTRLTASGVLPVGV